MRLCGDNRLYSSSSSLAFYISDGTGNGTIKVDPNISGLDIDLFNSDSSLLYLDKLYLINSQLSIHSQLTDSFIIKEIVSNLSTILINLIIKV